MANRIGGYPKDNGRVLADGAGNQIGRGRKISCSRIRPGAPGSWISSERCSYQFIVAGKPYSCRGYGDGIAVSCREMKKAPKGLSGAKRSKRGLGFPLWFLHMLPPQRAGRRRRRR